MTNKLVKPLFFLVSTSFFLVSHTYLRLEFHELWKDEWQSWFVVRDMNFTEMLKFLYYEGHPSLWYIYLVPFTFLKGLFSDIALIKLAHILPFILMIGWVLTRIYVPLFYRILVLGGYFFVFEYGMISRGYILVLLLMFVIMDIYIKKMKPHWILAILILLLCQTEVYGLIMAFSFLIFVVLNEKMIKFNQNIKLTFNPTIGWALLGGFIGLILFYITINWAPDASEVRVRLSDILVSIGGKTGYDIAFQGIFANGFLPGIIPDTSLFGVSTAGWIVGCINLLAVLFIFRKDTLVLVSFLVMALITFLFAANTYAGGMRQWGMVFVYFIVCCFLIFSRKKQHKAGNYLLSVFLLVHLYYGALAIYKEIKFPFTNAKETGVYIKDNVLENIPIVAISPFNTASAAGYANRKFYALPDGESFTYFRWLDKVYLPPQDELKLFARYKNTTSLIVITHQPVDPARYPELQMIKAFDRFNLKNENFYLYRLQVP